MGGIKGIEEIEKLYGGAKRNFVRERMELDADPEFEKFWEFYPKKKSKGDAYKAWIQTEKKRPALQSILKALVVLRASQDWLKDAGQYIPYPATWIRSWGWADVPEADKTDVVGDKMWWQTVSGVNAKAKELGMEWDALHGETYQKFAARVKEAANLRKVIPIAAGGE